MLDKKSKTLIIFYSFLLLGIILLSSNETIKISLVIGVGVFSLITSIFIINNVKRLKKTKISRIFSIILINLIFYSSIIFSVRLSNLQEFRGWEGTGLFYTLIILLIVPVISSVIGSILIVKCKTQDIEAGPNKLLLIVLLLIIGLNFYSLIVSKTAELTNSPSICLMHIGLSENSYIFNKVSRDACVWKIGLNNADDLNMDYCKEIGGSYDKSRMRDRCISLVAHKNNDPNLCYEMTEENQKFYNCVSSVECDIQVENGDSSCLPSWMQQEEIIIKVP